MSVKLQVSYSEEKELQEVIKHLGKLPKKIKRKDNQLGKFKIAYITINTEVLN